MFEDNAVMLLWVPLKPDETDGTDRTDGTACYIVAVPTGHAVLSVLSLPSDYSAPAIKTHCIVIFS